MLPGSSASPNRSMSSSASSIARSASSARSSPTLLSSTSCQFGGLNRSVGVLAQDHQIKHANEPAVDQRVELGRHLAGEVGLVGRELDDQVVDRPKHVQLLSSSTSNLLPSISSPLRMKPRITRLPIGTDQLN